MSNGWEIPGTPLSVDVFRKRSAHRRIFFLTHCHSDHTIGLTSSWMHRIYCSAISKKLLMFKRQVKSELLNELTIGQSHIIPLDEYNSAYMTVTVLDAHHCPGAVMYLFEGSFGTIFYTGDFRYHDQMFKPGSPLITKSIETLYMDNTYCYSTLPFPSREKATAEIIKIIEGHAQFDVIIGLDTLGKEDLLLSLSEFFKVKILVEENRYEQMKVLNMPNVFCTTPESVGTCQIRTKPLSQINKANVLRWNETRPTVAILPTARLDDDDVVHDLLGVVGQLGEQLIYIVRYSEHSSLSELELFVEKVKPKLIQPIVRKGKGANLHVYFPGLVGKCDESVTCSHLKEAVNCSLAQKRTVAKYRSRPSICPARNRHIKKGVHYNSPVKLSPVPVLHQKTVTWINKKHYNISVQKCDSKTKCKRKANKKSFNVGTKLSLSQDNGRMSVLNSRSTLQNLHTSENNSAEEQNHMECTQANIMYDDEWLVKTSSDLRFSDVNTCFETRPASEDTRDKLVTYCLGTPIATSTQLHNTQEPPYVFLDPDKSSLSGIPHFHVSPLCSDHLQPHSVTDTHQENRSANQMHFNGTLCTRNLHRRAEQEFSNLSEPLNISERDSIKSVTFAIHETQVTKHANERTIRALESTKLPKEDDVNTHVNLSGDLNSNRKVEEDFGNNPLVDFVLSKESHTVSSSYVKTNLVLNSFKDVSDHMECKNHGNVYICSVAQKQPLANVLGSWNSQTEVADDGVCMKREDHKSNISTQMYCNDIPMELVDPMWKMVMSQECTDVANNATSTLHENQDQVEVLQITNTMTNNSLFSEDPSRLWRHGRGVMSQESENISSRGSFDSLIKNQVCVQTNMNTISNSLEDSVLYQGIYTMDRSLQCEATTDKKYPIFLDVDIPPEDKTATEVRNINIPLHDFCMQNRTIKNNENVLSVSFSESEDSEQLSSIQSAVNDAVMSQMGFGTPLNANLGQCFQSFNIKSGTEMCGYMGLNYTDQAESTLPFLEDNSDSCTNEAENILKELSNDELISSEIKHAKMPMCISLVPILEDEHNGINVDNIQQVDGSSYVAGINKPIKCLNGMKDQQAGVNNVSVIVPTPQIVHRATQNILLSEIIPEQTAIYSSDESNNSGKRNPRIVSEPMSKEMQIAIAKVSYIYQKEKLISCVLLESLPKVKTAKPL